MQADAEARIFLCQLNSLIEAGFVDHQTGGGEDAFAMRADDGLIDGLGQPKVIRIDNEAVRSLRRAG